MFAQKYAGMRLLLAAILTGLFSISSAAISASALASPNQMPIHSIVTLRSGSQYAGQNVREDNGHSYVANLEFPSEELEKRTIELIGILNGANVDPEIFTTEFLSAVPPSQMEALALQLATANGPLERVISIKPVGKYQGDFVFRYANADYPVQLVLDRKRPWQISGLWFGTPQSQQGSVEQIFTAMQQLPGRTSIGIFRLENDRIVKLAGFAERERFAIASAFKLYILAALDQQIKLGQRSWDDVVTLGPKSHPTGVMQDWPDGSQVTLHTLATQMISISDNTATDTLIRVLGQEVLAQMVAEAGHQAADDLAPFLMTQQAAALKMPANSEMREQFIAADEAGQRAVILKYQDRLRLDSVDMAELTSKPLYIDDIEWFASAADMARLMNWLRVNASDTTKEFLSINPGLDAGAAKKWRYMGYKGGSEPGVIVMDFLLQHRSGEWLAVSVNWNNNQAALDEAEFFKLVARLLDLLASQNNVNNM